MNGGVNMLTPICKLPPEIFAREWYYYHRQQELELFQTLFPLLLCIGFTICIGEDAARDGGEGVHIIVIRRWGPFRYDEGVVAGHVVGLWLEARVLSVKGGNGSDGWSGRTWLVRAPPCEANRRLELSISSTIGWQSWITDCDNFAKLFGAVMTGCTMGEVGWVAPLKVRNWVGTYSTTDGTRAFWSRLDRNQAVSQLAARAAGRWMETGGAFQNAPLVR